MKSTETAIYKRIADYIRDLVADGQPGDRLPSEADLCQRFDVSRMTARHAIQDVAAEGLIERRRGAGTFVRSRPVPRHLGSPLSFSENMRSRGMVPSSELLSWSMASPSPDECEALGIAAADSVFILERLRRADDIPMALERAAIPEALGRSIAENFDSSSLHELFKAAGRVPATAHAEVSARRASKREQDLLDLPSSGVVIVEKRTIFDQEGVPLERTSTWYAAERYSFRAVLIDNQVTAQ